MPLTPQAIPASLAATVVAMNGRAGTAWLRRLPATVAACESRWSLTVLPPFRDLSFNYIAPALQADGSEAILKIGMPGADVNPEFSTEIEALVRFDGRGCVRLLRINRQLGALLLERVRPGTILATLGDDGEATRIAARVMRRLWHPITPPHPFPTVARWGRGFARMRRRFGGGTGPLPSRLTERGEGLFAELLDSMDDPVVLHGDLHHWNILSAIREPWLAIDPKGVIGEPAYEVGALLRNRTDRLPRLTRPGDVVRRRAGILSEELGFEEDRLLGWGLAQAILSAWWDIEDGTGTGESAIRVAHLIDQAMS